MKGAEMQKILTLIFSLLFGLFTLLLVLLLTPSITRNILEKTLTHFLEVNASVTHAGFSSYGFSTRGVIDQNDTFDIKVIPLSFSNYLVHLDYDGNVHTFSKVATVELPYIKTQLHADFKSDGLSLDLQGKLLEGEILADLDLTTLRYHYKINNLKLDHFKQQQHPALEFPLSGALSAQGEGVISAPYGVSLSLKSKDLYLDTNTTKMIDSQRERPLLLHLSLDTNISANDLNATLSLHNSYFDLDVQRLFFDFNQSLFKIDTTLQNYAQKLVPIQNVKLTSSGMIKGPIVSDRYKLDIDGYTITSDQLTYDTNTSILKMPFNLVSKEAKPLNFQGDNALYGKLYYDEMLTRLKFSSKSLNNPILLTIEGNKLHFISNNISLNALQKIANQELIAKGDVTLSAEADLKSDPLLWSAKLQSKNLQLPWKYRKDLGLKNNLALHVKAKNIKSGDIIVRPSLWSNILVLNHSALRYKPKSQQLYFNLNAQKIATNYYSAPKLNIKGSLDLKHERLRQTTVVTPHEKITIKNLNYADNKINTLIDFQISRLDRFAKLNEDYKLSGQTHIIKDTKSTTVDMTLEQLGELTLSQQKDIITLKGKKLSLEALLSLTNQPILMEGDLDYTLFYAPKELTATLNSKDLRGHGDMSERIRPFALNFATVLVSNKKHYKGNAHLRTNNETFKITKVEVDLEKQRFKGNFDLSIAALENNTFILPQELQGPLKLDGSFEQNTYQYITLNLHEFQLPKAWHQKLDKNATTYLDTNASLQAYNDRGKIYFGADIKSSLLNLELKESDYDLKTGGFHLHTALKTKLWLQDTNMTAQGQYQEERLYIPKATIQTDHNEIKVSSLHYDLKDQNLSTQYALVLHPYPGAPFYSKAEIYGTVQTKPALFVSMKSKTLGGHLDAYLTDKKLKLDAENLSVVKLVAFSGKKVPISSGQLNATIDIHAPDLFSGQLETLSGRSDINVSDMVLEGTQLDDILATLKDSQNLNLFEGRLGDLPIIRSVKEIPSDLTSTKVDKTHFKKIRFLTDLNESKLHCSDCAIATEENLIAIRGDVNLSTETFDNFYIGLLFPTNCAYYIQQVEGNISEPQVKLAAAGFNVVGGAAKSLVSNVGSVLDIGAGVVKGTGSFVGDAASYVPIVGETTDNALTSVTNAPKNLSSKTTECTPFYTGSIHHPQEIKKGLLRKLERAE